MLHPSFSHRHLPHPSLRLHHLSNQSLRLRHLSNPSLRLCHLPHTSLRLRQLPHPHPNHQSTGTSTLHCISYKQQIIDGECLDKLINAAQRMLRLQFPAQAGQQDTQFWNSVMHIRQHSINLYKFYTFVETTGCVATLTLFNSDKTFCVLSADIKRDSLLELNLYFSSHCFVTKLL